MSSPQDGYELIARPNERRIVADTDVWCVYELPGTSRSLQHGSCLVFESTKVFRRVRRYPRNWRELPDGELILLKDRT